MHASPLPQFSIISAGSAALAIQTQLKKYGLPNLKILVDVTTAEETLKYLRGIGCEIYKARLGEKVLLSSDILRLTENPDGFDITSNKAFDPAVRFYDWMSYEILNENPEYVFVPYGTGQLYENILNVAKKICTDEQDTAVCTGSKDAICKCHFIGATSNDPETLAVKLYAPFRPFTQSSPEWIRLFILEGYCGNKSQIIEVSQEGIEKGKEIMDEFGVQSEYSGSSALGLLYEMKDQIPKDSKIIVVNTGKAKMG